VDRTPAENPRVDDQQRGNDSSRLGHEIQTGTDSRD